MTDYASFQVGATQYPLPTNGTGIGGFGASLLRDADPAVFYLLEFYASVLRTHVGPRLIAEAASGGMEQITTAVAETLPFNPEPFLTEQHVGFPLLAAYRKSSKFEDIGGQKHSVDEIEVAYILPPLQAGEAERLLPILKAVAGCIDNRTEQGMDPAYTPTAPTGSAGDLVWERAGVTSAGVKSVSYGGYGPTETLYFPAVILTVEVKERSQVVVTEFGLHNGETTSIDIFDPVQETTVSDVVQVSTYAAPTLTSISPTTGSKAGGTTITVTGTDFRVGTLPRIKIGGLYATAVNVVSATSATCVSPAHDAFTTFAADFEFEAIDGQSDTLTDAFTFTTP